MNLRRDLKLFFKNPKAYLYTFQSPRDGKVIIKPFDKKDLEFAKKLVLSIQKKAIGLSLVLVGSLALGIAGEGDIDMVGASNDPEIEKHVPAISSVLGNPQKIRSNFIEWHTKLDGRNVELVLAEKRNPIVAGPILSYEAIKRSPDLLKEYEKMKLTADGVNPREYRRRKMEFFFNRWY